MSNELEKFQAGRYLYINDYKCFVPSIINCDWQWKDAKLNKLLAEANRQIGELNAYSLLIPNVDLYIQMHVKVEANKSSKIEGTKTNIAEDLLDISDVVPEKRDDWQEVQNYVKALNYGILRIREGFPLCNRLIKEMHKILLEGVRGEHKTPGEFRLSQNWIGGSRPGNASYVPPVHTELPECLSDFEKFINNNKIDTPHLIRIALLHYQFESIHPFLDGNGRIGRLLIPLYLQSKGLLEKPCLYISDYIEKNKNEYYEKLNLVRTDNDIIGWIYFFLEAVIETSKEAKEKFKNIVKLTQRTESLIANLPIKAENSKKIINVLYLEPIINRNKLALETNIKLSTINGIINILVEAGILKEITGFSRNQVFVFEEYLNMFG